MTDQSTIPYGGKVFETCPDMTDAALEEDIARGKRVASRIDTGMAGDFDGHPQRAAEPAGRGDPPASALRRGVRARAASPRADRTLRSRTPHAAIVAPSAGRRADMAERLDFVADGKVKADFELQPLAAINDVFERLRHADVPSRVVLDFAAAEAAASRNREP